MDDWPGIRFCPTEDEMISRNLHCKLIGMMLPVNEFINEIGIYNFDPWDLRFQSKIKSRDPVWYFFVENHGDRQNRTTISGFWKITGKPVLINDRWGDWSDAIGFKRHLRFHYGKTTNEGKGDWFIDEYHNTMLPQSLRTHVMCRVRYSGMNKNMIFDNATEFSADFVPRLTNSVVNQPVQGHGGSVNNLSEYDSVNQMDQSIQTNWGSSSHLSEYDPVNQIQHYNENFNTQEQAPYFASNDIERQMLWNNIGDLLGEGGRNQYTYMQEDCNKYQPKNPVTKVFNDYSSDSDNESTLFGDTSSSVDSVGNPNELISAPIPPLDSTDQHPATELQTCSSESSEEVKMELLGKEKVKNKWEMNMAEDSCIKKTPATNIEKKTPKWIYLKNKESWVVAVLLLFYVFCNSLTGH